MHNYREAPIAQLAERMAVNHEAIGSNPIGSEKLDRISC